MKANSKLRRFVLAILLLCIALACKKGPGIQTSTTFLKTYQTDSSVTALSLAQMPDGGFIIISSEGAGRPLMTRTDKYGNLAWNRAVQQYGFQNYYANAFLLADGYHFVAHGTSNLYKFDTLGNLNFVSIPNPNNLTFDDMSHLGLDFMLPACSSQFGGYPENDIYVYDENLNYQRTDSFRTAGIGGEILGLYISNVSSTGTYNVSGNIYSRVNWTSIDPFKLFTANIPAKGKTTTTIIDTGDQASFDVFASQTFANDSGEVILTERFSSTANTYYPVVVKFDKNLNVVWQKEFLVNTATIQPEKILSCKDGGFIVVGSIQSTGTPYTQPYALKIDANGNKLWDKAMTSSSLEGNGNFNSALELSDGSLAFIGSTSQFGKGLNGTRILFVKTDANGNL